MVIEPDLAHCAGVSGKRKIASLAKAAHVGACPHYSMEHVVGGVALTVAPANFAIQEEAVQGSILDVSRGRMQQ